MTDTRSKEMTRLAITALEDKKAEDISIIDISEVSVLAETGSYLTLVISSSISLIKKTVYSMILKESGETEKELHGKISINPR